MMRGVSRYLVAPLVLTGLLLSGCRFGDSGREPWRAEAEEQCLAEKGVVASAFMEPLSTINGDGTCGMEYPFRVHALAEGNVVVEPAARLACPIIRETDHWVQEVVQPAALAWLGQPVVAIRQMSSYSCRTMNGQAGAKISEHAFGNALDIGAFRVADGRWITVKNGWKGTQEERGFLLQVQAGACERYTTVLAPGSNVFHYDHIHVDLMPHAKGRTICKPAPRPLPAPNMAPPPMTASQPLPLPAAADQPLPPPAASPAVLREEAPPPVPARAPLPPVTPPPVTAPAPPPVPQQGIPQPPGRLPPGWEVGPEGQHPPGPMSYTPSSTPRGGKADPVETGSIKGRKYYTAPVPQPSTMPLPKARPGED